jgi:hypothetical protein
MLTKKLRAALVVLLMFCGFVAVVPLAGCQVREAELWPIRMHGYNHYTDHLIDYYITYNGRDISGEGLHNGGGGAALGGLQFPSKWRPGLKVTVHWQAYALNRDKTVEPPLQSAEVEVPRYSTKDVASLNIHFFPNGKVKAIVTIYGMGGPFYPLPKEEWPPFKVDQEVLEDTINYPDSMMDALPPSEEDIKWFEQWAPFPKEYIKRSK